MALKPDTKARIAMQQPEQLFMPTFVVVTALYIYLSLGVLVI